MNVTLLFNDYSIQQTFKYNGRECYNVVCLIGFFSYWYIPEPLLIGFSNTFLFVFRELAPKPTRPDQTPWTIPFAWILSDPARAALGR